MTTPYVSADEWGVFLDIVSNTEVKSECTRVAPVEAAPSPQSQPMLLYDGKVYLADSKLCRLEANVVLFEKFEQESKHGTHKLVLDKTIFHPQGGGQPSDKGSVLSATGDRFEVAFVQNGSNGVELIGSPSENVRFEPGSTVKQEVDAPTRHLHMRLHSAGHAIDAAVRRLGLWDRFRSGKGYHFPDNPYVEYVGSLGEDELKALPEQLNEALRNIIAEDIPTECTMMTKADAAIACGCDTAAYPDTVRVANVAGFAGPCGGTHIGSTRELGNVIITRIKKKKQNVRVSYEVRDV